jgi:hypothetical protein
MLLILAREVGSVSNVARKTKRVAHPWFRRTSLRILLYQSIHFSVF